MATKGGQEFRADLVIDAAGRRSPVPGWLAAGGYAPPRQVEVDPHVTYSSRLYRMPTQVNPFCCECGLQKLCKYKHCQILSKVW